MKKILVSLGIIFCLQIVLSDSVFAFTGGHSSIPGTRVNVINKGNGVSTVNYSRPIVYLGGGAKKRPPYYKECKKKLGYWDENLCAQYYIPKMFEEWDKQEQDES